MRQERSIFSRRPLMLLSTFCAILCLITVLVWIESYRRASLSFSTGAAPTVGWRWSSARGKLMGLRFDPPVPLRALAAETPDHFVNANGQAYGLSLGTQLHGPGGDRLLGLYFYYGGVLFTGTTGSRFREFGIRYNVIFWLAALGALPAATEWGRDWFRRRRARVGHCSKCGYDLRATPERCPECGTHVTGRTAAA